MKQETRPAREGIPTLRGQGEVNTETTQEAGVPSVSGDAIGRDEPLSEPQGFPAPDDTAREPSAAHGQAEGPQRGNWRDLRETVMLPPGALDAAKAVRYGEPTDVYTWDYVAEASLLAVAPLIVAADRAKVAAIAALCGEGVPSVAVDRIEAILRDDKDGSEETQP